ncbi:RNA polymerase sigma factor [Bordetella sp. BOR01]|uniref:RNA polymerase sigma factor n=1 Tax=Bordetella sp. BOR01 TaxID=2854779 RepID=UPI001C47BE22|nr:sigma-70 family RNA polymerase sigma factor [Bordetella sp. BOR01]MBV7486271.1 sigma-70 family RNA polymerase sigma factor [Bordetella sp. BOR01]
MVARYYPELLNFFSRSLGNRDAAADVVQEAFARVLTMHASGKEVFDLRALLFRTGKNLIVSDARRRAAETRMLDTLQLISIDNAPSVEQQIDARLQLERLLARLSVMPRKRREAFILVRIYGYSYAEAGEFMGIAASAVDKHVVRGVLDCMRHKAP